MKTPARIAVALTSVAALSLVAAPANAAGSGFKFVKAQYDSPGSDTGSNTSLNNEYVVIKNVTHSTHTLTGWTVSDQQGHEYEFDKTTVKAGATVTLHTGRGTDAGRQRYGNADYYIWNNDQDKAALRRPDGSLADTCYWHDSDSSPINC